MNMKTYKKIIRTTCKSCHGGCGVLVAVENNKVMHIEGDPDSLTRGTMCAKGIASVQDVNNPNRILYPLKRKGERGHGEWERISWDEALDTIADRMKSNIRAHGPASISICQGTGRGYNTLYWDTQYRFPCTFLFCSQDVCVWTNCGWKALL